MRPRAPLSCPHSCVSFVAQTRIDNKKRDKDIHEKRVFGLAKQMAAQMGMIGVKYEMTSIANVLQARTPRSEGWGWVGGGGAGDSSAEACMVAFAANLNHARMLAACPPPRSSRTAIKRHRTRKSPRCPTMLKSSRRWRCPER